MQRELLVPALQWWWNAPHTDFPAQIPAWLQGIRPDALEAFLKVDEGVLDGSFPSGVTAHLIGSADVDALQKGGFWRNFYDRYPSAGGYIQLSGIGWSADRQEALAYCAAMSESLSVRGFLILLRHDGKRWIIARSHQVWQS